MFKFRNIDEFMPFRFEKVGMLKGKRWYVNPKESNMGLFKPQRHEFNDRKVFCANHYGEFMGSVLTQNADTQVCKAELAHLSRYYSNIHKERNHGTPEEKDGCIIYSQLERGDTLEAGILTIEKFRDTHKERYSELIKDERNSQNINDNVELVLASGVTRVEDFYRNGGHSEEFIQARMRQTRKRIIEMIVYDCLYGNYDRHDENWSMHLKASGDIDLYPLYDNEKVLGLYENQNFIEDILGREDIERRTEEKFFSRMHVPGETKNNSTYKDMLEYLMKAYPHETMEMLVKYLSKNTGESIRKHLEECERLPSVYVEFGTQMYTYRNTFAKELLERNKNLELIEKER